MRMKREPKEIWEEYIKGRSFNNSINLYDTVHQNQNFFNGKQWEGVNAPDLEKPVFNFLKRVVMYFVSMIVSDDISASLTPFVKSDENGNVANIISAQIPKILENAKAKKKFRDLIKDAAIDGDSYLHIYFDVDKESEQEVTGDIEIEIAESTKTIFGNPYENQVQKQPYIIIVQRKALSDVIEEAAQYGISLENKIQTNSDTYYAEEGTGSDELVTCLIKMWREDGTIKAIKTTADEVIRPEYDTGYKLYPISSFIWSEVKSIYHGISAISEFIPNQIAVNKLYAMAFHSVKTTAFPTTVYDIGKFPRGFTNRVGKAIGVSGNVNDAIWRNQSGADMSVQVMQLISDVIEKSRDFMGASDSALGNVNPDNTSAIIVAREATAVPLQLQQMGFYQCVEDAIRVFIDIMRVNYGIREVSYEDSKGNQITEYFDFETLENYNYKLNVDIGPSSYWSEITNSQRWDNLLKAGIISDNITYLEGIPVSQLPQKEMLIKKLKQEKEAAMNIMQNNVPVNESGGEKNEEVDIIKVLSQLTTEELEALEGKPELLEKLNVKKS